MKPAHKQQVIFLHPKTGEVIAGRYDHGYFSFIESDGSDNEEITLLMDTEVKQWQTAESAWNAGHLQMVRSGEFFIDATHKA
jgi:hypothetical protein